jgi:hypothetical protein
LPLEEARSGGICAGQSSVRAILDYTRDRAAFVGSQEALPDPKTTPEPVAKASAGGFLPVLLIVAVLLCDGILGFTHQVSCDACGPTEVLEAHHGSATGLGEAGSGTRGTTTRRVVLRITATPPSCSLPSGRRSWCCCSERGGGARPRPPDRTSGGTTRPSSRTAREDRRSLPCRCYGCSPLLLATTRGCFRVGRQHQRTGRKLREQTE